MIPEKVAALNNGHSYVEDIRDETLVTLVQAGLIQASTSYDALAEADAISICVPTPLNKTCDPDVRYVIAAGESVARYIHPGMLVVLESTTYPGTTKELLLPMLVEGSGLKVGEDLFVIFSPERIDPGNKQYTGENTPEVIDGVKPHCPTTPATWLV